MDPVFPSFGANATFNDTKTYYSPTPTYVGFSSAVAAVVLYASCFVPVKKYKTGDGMFFQWILCNGIFLTGLFLQITHNCEMYLVPMLGGVIWAIGNLCVVPIIKTIGMGLGLSIWGTSAMCVGWAIGRFGLFGTEKATIRHQLMNNFSIVLVFIGIFVLLNVKNEVSSSYPEVSITVPDQENSPLFGNGVEDKKKRRGQKCPTLTDKEEEAFFMEKLPENTKRLIGSFLSVFSGLLYGVNFTPTLYVQNNYDNASSEGLDYVFAQFCGIYLASTVFFVVYCVYRKNKPHIYPQVILPGLASGVMWAIATGCWNVANSALSQAISFPIVATGPCGLASLFWGAFMFGEIRGCKNITTLTAGFLINLAASLLAGFSK